MEYLAHPRNVGLNRMGVARQKPAVCSLQLDMPRLCYKLFMRALSNAGGLCDQKDSAIAGLSLDNLHPHEVNAFIICADMSTLQNGGFQTQGHRLELSCE